jgi:DNA mismatch repair protein MutL
VGRIRILSDEVANKIAAGEVVERPASVVKELLENSLDAGAARVAIDVAGGGRRLIRISDDGCGMLRDDAMLAFERHATSKLSSAKDLLNISTLGFRGEALPSIGSVSRLLLETRPADQLMGTVVEIAGAKMIRCEEAALAPGTQITVRDLFYNVPARKKFLRSDETELAHIARLATHYSLANPDKRFLLTSEGKTLLEVTPVGSARERVYQVFGSETFEELIDLGVRERALPAGEGEEPKAFRLRGFVSRPQIQKLNRNSIYLFVNRRLIRDRLLLHALSAAYHNLIPPSCFPFALLFLECDAAEVDVNVHPAKTEVRFRSATFVHDFLRDSVREALIAAKPVSTIPLPARAQPAAKLPYSEFTQKLEDSAWKAPVREFAPVMPNEATRLDLVEQEQQPRLAAPETHGAFPPELVPELSESLAALADLRPLGQIHDSFIVAAGRDGLWIIDQHVAHERILFEKILKQHAAGRVEMQALLMPLIVQLTPAQQVDYDRIAGELAAVGFDAEPFGHRTIAVKAAPAGVGAGDIERLVFEILEIADRELRKLSMDDVRRSIAASIACRAAIKVNMRLDQGKMEWLLKALAGTECPMSCPHGRPIALRYSLRDILRGFHRI